MSAAHARATCDAARRRGREHGPVRGSDARVGWDGRILSFEPLPDAFAALLEKAAATRPGSSKTSLSASAAASASINVAGNSMSSSLLRCSMRTSRLRPRACTRVQRRSRSCVYERLSHPTSANDWSNRFASAPVDAMQVYDDIFVPGLFIPWANLLLDEVGLTRGEAVLDVACGPGTVTRLAAGRVGAERARSGCRHQPRDAGDRTSEARPDRRGDRVRRDGSGSAGRRHG